MDVVNYRAHRIMNRWNSELYVQEPIIYNLCTLHDDK